MTVFIKLIWLSGVVLELVLLVRARQGRMLSRFPVFYSYIFFVLLQSIVLYALYPWKPLYATGYWTAQALALVIGSLIVVEIYRLALRRYPGTSRMARNALLFVFALTVAKVIVYQSNGTFAWLFVHPEEFERSLRVVQACAILVILAVLLLYAIPCNRNVKGILAGYSLFVGTSIFELSLLSHFGNSFHSSWTYVHQLSYLLSLCIWTYALWSPADEPVLPPPSAGRYDEVSAKTRDKLSKLPFGLPKAAGQ